MSPQPDDSYFNIPCADSSMAFSSNQKLPGVKSVLGNKRYNPYQQTAHKLQQQNPSNKVNMLAAHQAGQNPCQKIIPGSSDCLASTRAVRVADNKKQGGMLDATAFENLCKDTLTDFDDSNLKDVPKMNPNPPQADLSMFDQNNGHYKLPEMSVADAQSVCPTNNQNINLHVNKVSQMPTPAQSTAPKQHVNTVSQIRFQCQQAPLQIPYQQSALALNIDVQANHKPRNGTLFKHPAPVTRQNNFQQQIVPKQSPSLIPRNHIRSHNLANRTFLRQPISNVATYQASRQHLMQQKMVQAPAQLYQKQINRPVISTSVLPHNQNIGGQFVNQPQQHLQPMHVQHNQVQVFPRVSKYMYNRPQQVPLNNVQSQIVAMQYQINDSQLISSGSSKRFSCSYKLKSVLGKGGQGCVYQGNFYLIKSDQKKNCMFVFHSLNFRNYFSFRY